MKKILFMMSSLACITTVQGQTDPNRTAKTKVIDAVAKMPAQSVNQYQQLMNDLVSSKHEGINALTAMFESVNNDKVAYALNGWANHISNGSVANQKIFIDGIAQALASTSNREIKAFYIRLLQAVGTEKAVPVLAKYVNDNQLAGPVIRALVANATPLAKELLQQTIDSSDNLSEDLAEAAGDLQLQGTQSKLIAATADADEEELRAIYYALGRLGGLEALEVLEQAMREQKAKLDYTNATGNYIECLESTLTQYPKVANKSLQKLYKSQKYPELVLPAFDLLVANNPSNATKYIIDLMKKGDHKERAIALYAAEETIAENPDLIHTIIKSAEKAKEDEQLDYIRFFKRNEKLLDENTRISVQTWLIELIEKREQNKLEAISTLAIVGNEASVDALLSFLKSSSDKETTQALKDALLISRQDILAKTSKLLTSEQTPEATAAAIEVLAQKKARTYSGLIIDKCSDQSQRVSLAAYKSLRNIGSEDIKALYSLLDGVKGKEIAYVQDGIITEVSKFDSKTAFNNVANQMKLSSDKTKYYRIIASIENENSLPLLYKSYEKGTKSERSEAFNALLEMNTLEAAAILTQIVEAKDADFSDKALTKSIQIIRSSQETGAQKLLDYKKLMHYATNNEQRKEIIQAASKNVDFLSLAFVGSYLSDTALQQTAAAGVHSIISRNKQLSGPIVADMIEKTAQVISGQDSDYHKSALKKRLAEMDKDQGYVAIFNGRDLSGWQGLVGNPISRKKMSSSVLAKKQQQADKAAAQNWQVEDGILCFLGKGDNLATKKMYGNFEMYVDWKIYAKGDAGIYLRGTPQVQIWDTSRVEVGAQVGSGGLYNNQKHISKPLKVADNAIGEWNTFYIKMVNDRVTVRLNGELVVDNIIMENYWNRALPIEVKEAIELQAHGTRIEYRDIYVNELPQTSAFELSAQEKKEGYQVLFDGTNLHRWQGNTVNYGIVDGVLYMDPRKRNTQKLKGINNNNLYTKEEYGDFALRFEFKLENGTNNGLGIRTPLTGDAAYDGIELQVLDNTADIYKNLEDYQYHGSIYGVKAAKRGALKPKGEWNYQEVIVKGHHIQVILNGETIIDCDVDKETDGGKNTIDKRVHPGLMNKKGYIGFLGHGDPVHYRNIRIKKLN